MSIVNISFKKLKGNVVDNYSLTLKNWNNKDIEFNNLHKLLGNSKIQFSNLMWDKGIKKPKFLQTEKIDCIILDIDDGMSIKQFQDMFKKYKYVIGTTKSHQQEKKGLICDRFRAVIKTINLSANKDVLLRSIELVAPFTDKQTLTESASYLGNDNAIIIYNDGMLLDMYKATELAKKQLKDEYVEKIVVDKDLIPTYSGGMSFKDAKEEVDYAVTIEILESLGVEIVGNKCKIRDERSHSCKIYSSGYMKDYGGEFKGDIFQYLMDYENMDFRDSIRYVQQFI